MPEPSTTSTGTEPDASTQPAKAPDAGVTTPAQEPDLSKLSGEQLAKVLENQELWKNPRLAGLLESDKQLKKLQKEQETEREKSLTEQKKFEDLANERGEKISTLEKQIQNSKIDQALTSLLVKEGVVDLDGALKLADRSQMSVDDNGVVSGADTALEGLKNDRAYLFNNSGTQPTVGSPSNPSNTTTGQPGQYKFKESQITPEFYKANEKDILEAYRLGLVEADGPPR